MLPANIMLALAAAVLWGGGDFAGGMGAKYAPGVRGAVRVVITSHATSLLVLAAIASLRGDAIPHGAPFYWAILSGVMACLSVTTFYIALSRGAMGASAAVSGLLAAAIPSAVAIAHDGRPGWLTMAGFLIAGGSIWLIAAGDNPESTPASASTMWLAVTAGAGFGVYFVALKYAAAAGLYWPMATARSTSVVCSCLVLAALTWTSRNEELQKVLWLPRRAWLWGLATAIGDTSGNVLFMAATRAGRLDVASVLASLYPASTILLAAWALHERPTRRQVVGMLIAAVAVVMITL